MVVLNTTSINVALPAAQQALHFTNADRQWVETGYSLAFGSRLPSEVALEMLMGEGGAAIAASTTSPADMGKFSEWCSPIPNTVLDHVADRLVVG